MRIVGRASLKFKQMDISSKYEGGELSLFENAREWKEYWALHVRPYLVGDILEVGAGIGINMEFLLMEGCHSWTCLEPDEQLLSELRDRCLKMPLGSKVISRQGTLASLHQMELFDTILYIDVLEHIEEDAKEMEQAAKHLRPGGRIVVLSPAHEFLTSPFDEKVGHYRRYSLKGLLATAPSSLELIRGIYLDSVGMVASLANRLLLRQALPNKNQIEFWNRYLIPLSRRCDRWLKYRLGKTVLGVWALPTST